MNFFPGAVQLWIFLSALLCSGGWILSGLNRLDRIGYGCLFGLGAASACWQVLRRQKGAHELQLGRVWNVSQRRVVGCFPFLFFVLGVLDFLVAGALCPFEFSLSYEMTS